MILGDARKANLTLDPRIKIDPEEPWKSGFDAKHEYDLDARGNPLPDKVNPRPYGTFA